MFVLKAPHICLISGKFFFFLLIMHKPSAGSVMFPTNICPKSGKFVIRWNQKGSNGHTSVDTVLVRQKSHIDYESACTKFLNVGSYFRKFSTGCFAHKPDLSIFLRRSGFSWTLWIFFCQTTGRIQLKPFFNSLLCLTCAIQQIYTSILQSAKLKKKNPMC